MPEDDGGEDEVPAHLRATWQGAAVTQAHVEWLRKSRRIPPEVEIRLAGGEQSPEPRDGECVVFLAHFMRGFGLPASDFLRDFMRKFQVQPHHLPANVFVFLSGFADRKSVV